MASPRPTSFFAGDLPLEARRALSQSDAGLERELDLRLSYRQGWPRLPVLPIKTVEAPENNPVSQHMDRISNIVRRAGIDPTNIATTHRLYGSTVFDNRFLTVSIVADSTAPEQRIWKSAIMMVRRYLQSRDLHVCIEFIDVHLAIRGSLFNRPDVEIQFPALDNDTLRKASQLLKSLSAKLEIMGKGLSRYELAWPTLVVKSSTVNDDLWWNEVKPYLQRIMGPTFMVELQYCAEE